jgi:ABC-2 type transport system ATP-binding protein
VELIEVTNLKKSFDYYEKDLGLKKSIQNVFYRKKLVKEAVRGINFSVSEGEIVGFLGPNGAGKTTTLKILSGILHPTDGEVSVAGYVPWKREKNFKMLFSIVMGQKGQLWWDLPANESLYLNKCIYEIEDEQYHNTVNELTDILEVKDLLKVQVRRLSLGERMKMELIAALIHKPKIIFLDEPTIGLDIVSQKRIRDFLKFHNEKEKTTILLTSHYMEDIAELCDRSIVINQGRVVFDGHTNEINGKMNQNKLIKIKLTDYVEQGQIDRFGKVRSFDGYNAVIETKKDIVNTCIKDMLDTLPIGDFNIEDIPIEEGITLLYQKEGGVDETSE